MASAPSQNDILLAILVELRIQSRLFADANDIIDDLDKQRADAVLIYPLLNTILTPTGG